MNDPVAIWGDKNIIIEGHGRLEALKELGYTEVDCIRLDHLTEEERKAYTLAHNKLTLNTKFDIDLLEQELESLMDIDMSDFGFEELNSSTPFDDAGFIDELLNEDFVDLNPNRDIFNVTLNFPIEMKDEINNYIKENGKDKLVDMIIEEVKLCQNVEAK